MTCFHVTNLLTPTNPNQSNSSPDHFLLSHWSKPSKSPLPESSSTTHFFFLPNFPKLTSTALFITAHTLKTTSFILYCSNQNPKSKIKINPMAPKPVSLQCKSVFLLFFLIAIQTSSSSPLFSSSSSSSDFNPPYPKAISVSFLLILLQIQFLFLFLGFWFSCLVAQKIKRKIKFGKIIFFSDS